MARIPANTRMRASRADGLPACGYSMLEVAVVVLLLGMLMVWAVPRMTASTPAVDDRTAQSHIDLAIEAAVAVRRDTGSFDPDLASLGTYLLDVDAHPADVSTLPAGDVSVGVDADAPFATVTAAALASDDVCWLLRREFGTGDGRSLHGYRTDGVCNADAAALLTIDPTDDARGAGWSRPLNATP